MDVTGQTALSSDDATGPQDHIPSMSLPDALLDVQTAFRNPHCKCLELKLRQWDKWNQGPALPHWVVVKAWVYPLPALSSADLSMSTVWYGRQDLSPCFFQTEYLYIQLL